MRGAQCCTQAGIEGLATCLRQELRPRGVDVSIVAAGEFASGTAWLSESTMLEQVIITMSLCNLPIYLTLRKKQQKYFQARNMWSQLSAEQKQNYGEDYFERALRSLEKYTEKVHEFLKEKFRFYYNNIRHKNNFFLFKFRMLI